jgi:hypothetical protein
VGQRWKLNASLLLHSLPAAPDQEMKVSTQLTGAMPDIVDKQVADWRASVSALLHKASDRIADPLELRIGRRPIIKQIQ